MPHLTNNNHQVPFLFILPIHMYCQLEGVFYHSYNTRQIYVYVLLNNTYILPLSAYHKQDLGGMSQLVIKITFRPHNNKSFVSAIDHSSKLLGMGIQMVLLEAVIYHWFPWLFAQLSINTLYSPSDLSRYISLKSLVCSDKTPTLTAWFINI